MDAGDPNARLNDLHAKMDKMMSKFSKNVGKFEEITNYLRRQHHMNKKPLTKAGAKARGLQPEDNIVSLAQTYLRDATQTISSHMTSIGVYMMDSLNEQDKVMHHVSSSMSTLTQRVSSANNIHPYGISSMSVPRRHTRQPKARRLTGEDRPESCIDAPRYKYGCIRLDSFKEGTVAGEKKRRRFESIDLGNAEVISRRDSVMSSSVSHAEDTDRSSLDELSWDAPPLLSTDAKDLPAIKEDAPSLLGSESLEGDSAPPPAVPREPSPPTPSPPAKPNPPPPLTVDDPTPPPPAPAAYNPPLPPAPTDRKSVV